MGTFPELVLEKISWFSWKRRIDQICQEYQELFIRHTPRLLKGFGTVYIQYRHNDPKTTTPCYLASFNYRESCYWLRGIDSQIYRLGKHWNLGKQKSGKIKIKTKHYLPKRYYFSSGKTNKYRWHTYYSQLEKN